MRRKIGLAVKRAMAARKRGGGVSRRVSRRRRVAVVAVAPRRAIRRRRVSGFGGYSVRRRRSGRRSFGGGGSIIKQLTSKSVLSLAAGAVGASFVTTFVMSRFAAQLPGANTQPGRLFYKLAIPAAGAFLVRKVNREAATGMLVGGVVMVVNDLIANLGKPGTVAGYSGYGGEADFATQSYMLGEGEEFGEQELGEYFDEGEELGAAEFNTDPLYQSQPAFATSFN